MAKDKVKKTTPTIENRKVYHDYYVEETLQCGIELRGNEVKSIRDGKASIKEAWISIENGEMFVKKMHVTGGSHRKLRGRKNGGRIKNQSY